MVFPLCSGKLNALLPDPDFGPQLNLLGLKTEDWIPANGDFSWVLEKPPTPISPADLYAAQKLTRAQRLAQPPNAPKLVGYCSAPISKNTYSYSTINSPSTVTSVTGKRL